MRGRKPKSPRLKDLGKPGLTPMPLETATPAADPVQASGQGDLPGVDIPENSPGMASEPANKNPILPRRGGGGGGGGAGGGKGRQGGPDAPPAWMKNKEAQAEWVRLIPLMRQRRQYIPLFEMELARYCVAAAQYIKAYRACERLGAVTKSSKGVQMLSQHWVVMSRAHEIMAKQAADLGFNSVAQMRLAGNQLDLFGDGEKPAPPTMEPGSNVVQGTPFGALRKPNG